MRVIPLEIESQLEKIGLTYHERQALFVYVQGGVSPPDWVREHIARRIGSIKYLEAWAVLTNNRVLEQFAQSNLGVRFDNFPALPLAVAL